MPCICRRMRGKDGSRFLRGISYIFLSLISIFKRTDIMASEKIRGMALCALMTAVIAVCSQIMIPTAIPFTLQTFAVFCALGVLGGKRGTVSVLLYVLLGAAGVPVFAEFTGGFGIIMGSTGGYIIGFVFSALIYWGVTRIFGDGIVSVSAAMGLGLLVCYAVGTLWFIMVYTRETEPVDIITALKWCVLPFIIPDVIKIALAVFVSRRVSRYAGSRKQPA